MLEHKLIYVRGTRAMFVNGVILLSLLLFASEANANESNHGKDDLFCPNQEDFRCFTGDFCIKSALQCDGTEDCPDGSDEIGALCGDSELCEPSKYHICKDNVTCIPQYFRCDGYNDCPSNDDEANCDRPKCKANEFTCLANSMCIPIEYVCDGIRQCLDGSDEDMDCRNQCRGFLCENEQCLLDKSWVCDGMNDCVDGSDEKDCASECVIDNKKFSCADNVTCIPIESVCNKEADCEDGSDEGGICNKFHNNTACELDFCPDNSECFITPNGPVCVCSSGFLYNSEERRCKDVNECEIYGRCSQGCINTQGSFYCTCANRFRLKNDTRSCVVNSRVDPLLFYAAKKSINAVSLRSDIRFVVTRDVRQPIGLSYDGHFIYWTNVAMNAESITKARVDGSKNETLVSVGLAMPEDVAIDWFTGNLYISDSLNMHIAVCANDGRHCTILITETVERPRGIALYPQEGRMFWSEWGQNPMIGEARMDGTLVSALVEDNLSWPSGIALDWPNSRLYWVDAKLLTIESCNLDGTGRHTVHKGGIRHPYGLAVFENNVYWSDWNKWTLETCNKFTCNDRKVIVKDVKIYDIHVYHNAMHPLTNNPCKNNNCTHLCLLASNETFTCACPVGMKLDTDKVSCSVTTPKDKVYIGMQDNLYIMEQETFGRHQVEREKVLPLNISKMALNSVNGHVFIADNAAKIIYDYDLANNTTMELVTEHIGLVSSMSFDHLSNNLYWSDSETGSIEVLSLNKKQRVTAYHYSEREKPIAIAVIPETGRMFVASRAASGPTQIYTQSLHGSTERHNIMESEADVIQFAVDQQLRQIYFCDSAMRRMTTAHEEGQSFTVVKQMANVDTSSIAILSEDIFWTKRNSLHVFRTWKENSDSTHTLILPSRSNVIEADVTVLAASPRIVVNHPCMVDNGGCSHICATYNATQKICLCPTGIDFTNSQNETCVDCGFRCTSGECITTSQRCNNFTDCADASDERDCVPEERESICTQNEFKCVKDLQCIAIELRCDTNYDCVDKSDEADCTGYNSTTKCHKDQFSCSDGQCIELAAVCDGRQDCKDGVDELQCFDEKAKKPMCKKPMLYLP